MENSWLQNSPAKFGKTLKRENRKIRLNHEPKTESKRGIRRMPRLYSPSNAGQSLQHDALVEWAEICQSVYFHFNGYYYDQQQEEKKASVDISDYLNRYGNAG